MRVSLASGVLATRARGLRGTLLLWRPVAGSINFSTDYVGHISVGVCSSPIIGRNPARLEQGARAGAYS